MYLFLAAISGDSEICQSHRPGHLSGPRYYAGVRRQAIRDGHITFFQGLARLDVLGGQSKECDTASLHMLFYIGFGTATVHLCLRGFQRAERTLE
jgi:hypothetical protein